MKAMFDVETEKLTIIENVIKTDNEFLLREIKSLLCEPSLKEYEIQRTPYSLAEFHKLIEESETAIAQGKVKGHAEVRNIINSWKSA
jgi:hypothetical protein